MSFSLAGARMLAPAPLDYRTLRTLIGSVAPPAPRIPAGATASRSASLHVVLHGHPGWQAAARALGGRFNARAGRQSK